MIFSSFTFIFLFIPFVFLLCEAPRFKKHQIAILILASFAFILHWSTSAFLLFSAVMLLNSLLIHYRLICKKYFYIIIFLNLLPLLYYKYGHFIASQVGINIPKYELPLAISFYTFVIIAYVVDIYRKEVESNSIRDFVFFTSFFPHLIAGPIVQHSDLIPQIYQEKDRKALFLEGCIYFIIGFCKKVYIADPLGTIANECYALTSEASFAFSDALLGTLSYSLQIYFDFSGYSDMAIGAGLLFGYRLPFNFNSPYKSGSISEFWQRWHITLSRFLKKYVYFPLGGNRVSKVKQYRNIFLVMCISGFWHGAGWGFIIWGALHGLIICLEKFFTTFFAIKSKIFQSIKIIYCFTAISLLWVLFRSTDLEQALSMYTMLFSGVEELTWESKEALYLCLGFALLFFPNSQQLTQKIYDSTLKYKEKLWHVAIHSHKGIASGLCLIIIVLTLFYSGMIDKIIYQDIKGISRYNYGTDNQIGDYRSNLLSAPILTKDNICVVVGSSFTGSLGSFSFEYNEKLMHSATVGMGGNSLVVGIRSAMGILDHKGLDTLILGISPLNLGKLGNYGPFKGQLYEGLNALGMELKENRFSSAQSLFLWPWEYLNLIINPDERYQFSEFIFKIATKFDLASFDAAYKTSWNTASDSEDWYVNLAFKDNEDALLQEWVKKNTQGIEPTSTNGSEKDFLWKKRGILESLEPKGDVSIALKALKKECDQRGIRFIIYSSPTPSHKEAPHIYPAGFYEAYQDKMHNITKELDIIYYDFSNIFPWDIGLMGDFIHPQNKAREQVHMLLIQKLYGED